MSFTFSDRNYNISVEAGDHGKPIRSATAFIHIILTEFSATQREPSIAATPPQSPPPPPPTFNPTVPVQQRQPPPRPLIAETPRFNPAASAGVGIGSQQQKLLLEGGNGGAGGMFRRPVYNVQVMENTAPLTPILSLASELMTELANVNLRLTSGNFGIFGIQETTGELILTGSPDREFKDSYSLTVKVRFFPLLRPYFRNTDWTFKKSHASFIWICILVST